VVIISLNLAPSPTYKTFCRLIKQVDETAYGGDIEKARCF